MVIRRLSILLLIVLLVLVSSSKPKDEKHKKRQQEMERNFLHKFGKFDEISSRIGNSGMKDRIRWCNIAYREFFSKERKKNKIPSTKGVEVEFTHEKHTIMLIDVVRCPPERNFFIRESVSGNCFYILKKQFLSRFFRFEDEICIQESESFENLE